MAGGAGRPGGVTGALTGRTVAASVLLDAAAAAPAAPGVYVFVGPDHDLLYVGKAADLRRRLRDHARAPAGRDLRSDARVGRVAKVAWEVCAGEREALLREADLIVALRPPYNASHAHGPPATFVALANDSRHGTVTFRLAQTPATPPGVIGVYGSFPHLAKGGAVSAATWTKRGYTALLRLLWAAQGTDRAARIPRALAGSSPPAEATIPVEASLRPALHRFLSGRGARLLEDLQETLALVSVPAYMHTRLAADRDQARELYEIGPRRVARFRHRHRLPPGPVTAATAAALLLVEVRAIVGDDRLTVPGPRR
jgi:predicted GIY-YIG superfamily endonuclease